MKLRVSEQYQELADKARWSHTHGRGVSEIRQADVDAARLFSYAYRSQAIGTFHATRIAIEIEEDKATGPDVIACLSQARTLLDQLEAKAGEFVPRDFRVLISTFYYYDQWVDQVARALEKASAGSTNVAVEDIRQRFLRNINAVTSCEGIYVARDIVQPEQGAFLVPSLKIAIVPVIYGDHHSWNSAFLAADQAGVAVHRHHQGAEIHLGFSPVKGRTILGSGYAEVLDGYAMPIPPMTDHGFLNTSGHDHVLPFVFGSLPMTGWGIFFDVEPRPDNGLQRQKYELESPMMNYSVSLDRAIQRMAAGTHNMREILIPAERAGSPEIGGLELAVNRIDRGEIDLVSEHYRIVSVRSGKGRVRIGGLEAELSEHDHFGIPADLTCHLTALGDAPLVFLDAMMLPIRTAK